MRIYLVGGAVRDELLGYPFSERDWLVVGARPEDLLNKGFEQVGKDFPVFLHPQTKEEYALARRERKTAAGYHGFVCDFGPEVSLEEDLLRRDLTINAIAKGDDGQIIDPYQGRDDLAAGLLRHVSPAFKEDPLRIFRVARFAARYAHLGFRIAPETQDLMAQMSSPEELQALSPERIMVEINKALGERHPSAFFNSLLDCGALAVLSRQWAQSFSAELLSTLDRAAEQPDMPLESRFALSCAELSADDCAQLCTDLRASKAASQISQAATKLLPLPSRWQSDTLLAVLEQLDYLRRPHLLAQLCLIAKLRGEPAQQTETLSRAGERLAQVNAKQWLEKGFKGAALGKAMRQERLALLDQLVAGQT